MVALVMLLWNSLRKLWGDYLTVVYRLPAAKSLRIHLFGLAAAVTGMLIASVVAYDPVRCDLESASLVYQTILWIAVICLGIHYFSGLTTALAFALYFLLPSFPVALKPLLNGYVMGYAFGFVFATLYNDVVYLCLRYFERHLAKVAFAVYADHTVNIIKSPIQLEEKTTLHALRSLLYYAQAIRRDPKDPNRKTNVDLIINRIRWAHWPMTAATRKVLLQILEAQNLREGLEKLRQELMGDEKQMKKALVKVEERIEPLLNLRQKQLYNFDIPHEPKHPYTILFVANPFIRKRTGTPLFEPDPIIDDLDLFLHSVNRALRGFEADTVLGCSEIWSRVRIVTVFDEKLKELKKETDREQWALIGEMGDVNIGGEVVENILDPLPKMTENVERMLERYKEKHPLNIGINDIDVIFGMSAWPTHDRSFAHFSDFHEEDGIVVGQPGRVALSVIGANQRTFIHEFAHAMSSIKEDEGGAITDEYADLFDLAEPKKGVIDIQRNNLLRPDFYLNRRERRNPAFPGELVPIPTGFTFKTVRIKSKDVDKDVDVVFRSDLSHPSEQENWIGYFPDRPNPDVGCIMDRYQNYYRFDSLIGNFMYDRLIAKINTPR